jgi:adenine-specific DNA-methyltransferase
MDPPYTNRGYGNNYFTLNSIANINEDPEVRGVTGIPVTGYNQSLWNNQQTAYEELEKILKGTKATKLVLSYSTDGLMKPERILEIFKEAGWDVTMKAIDQKRFKSHDLGEQNESKLKELLFLAKK